MVVCHGAALFRRIGLDEVIDGVSGGSECHHDFLFTGLRGSGTGILVAQHDVQDFPRDAPKADQTTHLGKMPCLAQKIPNLPREYLTSFL